MRNDPAAIREAAEAVASFNQDDLGLGEPRSRADGIAVLDRAATILRWASPDLGTRANSVVRRIAADLEEAPPGPTHRDLKTDHILLGGDYPALVDLDSFGVSDPILDPAAVLADLAGMSLRTSDQRWRAAAETFADEYFAHVPGTWRRRLPLHYAGAALKIAVGFFRRQETGWSGMIERMVKEAEESLRGRIW